MRTILICVLLTTSVVTARADDLSDAVQHQSIELENVANAIDANSLMQSQGCPNNAPRSGDWLLEARLRKISDLEAEVIELKRQRSNAVALLQKQYEELQSLKHDAPTK